MTQTQLKKTPQQDQAAGLQLHPALSILRMAASSAEPAGMLDDETLELMFERIDTGILAHLHCCCVRFAAMVRVKPQSKGHDKCTEHIFATQQDTESASAARSTRR